MNKRNIMTLLGGIIFGEKLNSSYKVVRYSNLDVLSLKGSDKRENPEIFGTIIIFKSKYFQRQLV